MTPAAPMAQAENLWREMLFIVFAQQRLIIAIATLIFTVVLAITFLATKQYSAQATLLISGKRIEHNPEMVEPLRSHSLPITVEDLNAELQLLTSPAVLKRSITLANQQYQLFDLDDDPATTTVGVGVQSPQLSQTISQLQAALNVTLVPASKVLQLTLQWHDAAQAKQLLEILLAQYFHYRNSVYKPNKIRDFYDQTVKDYQQALDKQQQQQLAIIDQLRATDADNEIEANLSLAKEYSQQLAQLEESRSFKQMQADLLQRQLPTDDAPDFSVKTVKLFSNIDNLTIRALALRVQQDLLRYNDIRKNFLAASSKTRGAKRTLHQSYDILLREIEAIDRQQQGELEAINLAISHLHRKLAALTQRNLDLARLQLSLDSLNRDKSLLEQSFATYYKRREEAHMFDRTQTARLNTQVILLTPAWADETAIFPNKARLLPFGLVIALLVALTGGFINEYFDDTIKRPDDSSKLIGVPGIISFEDLDPAAAKSRPRLWLWLVRCLEALKKNRLIVATILVPVLVLVLALITAAVLWLPAANADHSPPLIASSLVALSLKITGDNNA